MKLKYIVCKELWQRRRFSAASLAAILLGVGIMVSVQTIAVSGRTQIIHQVHDLGSNIVILPADAGVSDYYMADFGTETIPEEYAHRLHSSEFSDKVHQMIPKLSFETDVLGHRTILTGVLPQDEIKEQPGWRQTGFTLGSSHAHEPASESQETPVAEEDEFHAGLPMLQYRRQNKREAFESLGLREAILGSEAARILALQAGGSFDLEGRRFRVSQVLEQTGTVDDIRVFTHLHTVQEIAGTGKVVNAIEVVGCGCTKDLVKLSHDIEAMLPGTQVTTIHDIAQAQSNTITLMKDYAWVLFVIVMLIGGAGLANTMFADVHERRQEIGTLLALGATPRWILMLFLGKAAILGLAGGLLGYAVGTALALALGPYLLGVPVWIQSSYVGWSVAVAVVVCLAWSMIPARRAAHLDPAIILLEE